MIALDFITKDDFRLSLESDYTEMQICMEAGAKKAVLVLAGSIIETILIDTLLSSDYKKRTKNDPLNMDLYQAIKAAKSEGIITKREEDLSNVVRSYRNLIHPGRKSRLSEEVTRDGALIALSLVNLIIDKVKARKMKTYGHTAQQLVKKIIGDSTVLSIIGHLLKKNKRKRNRKITFARNTC